MTNSNPNIKSVTPSITSVVSAAVAPSKTGDTGIKPNVWTLPTSAIFTVTHAKTSNDRKRVILENVDGTVGTINLFYSYNETLLEELIPEGAYNGQAVIDKFSNLYFKATAHAGSDTPYNFQMYPTATALGLLELTSGNSQEMAFPTSKKSQLNGDEASLATAFNLGNKGVVAVKAAQVGGNMASAMSKFFGS